MHNSNITMVAEDIGATYGFWNYITHEDPLG
jgi:hypothetical protein